MNDEILGAILEAVFAELLDQPAERVTTAAEPGTWLASVEISGTSQATVTIWPSARLAQEIGVRMFALPPGKVEAAEITDALAEFCNVVAGGVKSVLPGPSHLSLPTVTSAGDWGNDDDPRLAEVHYGAGSGVMSVRVVAHQNACLERAEA